MNTERNVNRGAPWRMLMLRIAGGISFLMGAIGLVLPVWPTTVFWILAALAFAHSWPSMRERIFAWPKVGPVVQEFVEHGVLSRKGKQHAIFGMLLGLLIAAWLRPSILVLVATALLVLVGIAYVVTRPGERAPRRDAG